MSRSSKYPKVKDVFQDKFLWLFSFVWDKNAVLIADICFDFPEYKGAYSNSIIIISMFPPFSIRGASLIQSTASSIFFFIVLGAYEEIYWFLDSY